MAEQANLNPIFFTPRILLNVALHYQKEAQRFSNRRV